jgi:hypothetical protein
MQCQPRVVEVGKYLGREGTEEPQVACEGKVLAGSEKYVSCTQMHSSLPQCQLHIEKSHSEYEIFVLFLSAFLYSCALAAASTSSR